MKDSNRALRSVVTPAVMLLAVFFVAACQALPQFDVSGATAPAEDPASGTPAAAPTTVPATALDWAAPTNSPAASASAADKLDKAVSAAVIGRQWDDLFCEMKAEGHIILDTEKDKSGNTVVYAIASYVAFGFENNIFTVTSGSGAIPAVIVFSQSASGDYVLLSYTEPMDGSEYDESIHKLFPERLWAALANAQNNYPDLTKQQESQAEAYLKSIGKNAVVHAGYVEKESFRISVEASNTLIGITGNSEYPFWIGTRESVEGGVRYIYEATEEDLSGYTIITFTKKTENGEIAKQLKYRITGDAVELME